MWRHIALCFLLLSACQATESTGGERLRLVATTTMIADLVRELGGHRAEVTGIMAPGGDPHTYKPVPGDAQAIAKARLVFTNGLKLEHWIEDLIANAGGKQVVAVSTGLRPRSSPFDPAVPDPHFWFDVRRFRHAAKQVREALVEADPPGAATYRANWALYDTQLQDLDRWVRAQVAQVPAPRRKLVTSHDAFAYFGEAYGFTVIPIQGISTEAEASTRDLARVVEEVRRSGVKALFVETSVNPKLVEQVARETGARIGGALYSDSTGPLESSGGHYIGMVRDNVAQIVEGLR